MEILAFYQGIPFQIYQQGDIRQRLRYTSFIRFEQWERLMEPLKDIADQTSTTLPLEASAASLEERRRRRKAALKAAEGLWKDRTDIPKDGVEYQKQLRDEWR